MVKTPGNGWGRFFELELIGSQSFFIGWIQVGKTVYGCGPDTGYDQ
jgi:hypothetical protein